MADTMPPAPAPAVQDAAVAARVEGGHTWGDINNHVTQAAGAAVDAGYHPDTVAAYQGNAPASTAVENAEDHHAVAAHSPPVDETKAMRFNYADAVLNGSVEGPTQFAKSWDAGKAAAAQNALGPRSTPAETVPSTEKVADFPKPQDITDTAISAVHDQGLPLTPDNINTAKQNLAKGWVNTGTPPAKIAQQAPDWVTKAPAAPINDTVLGIFKALEGSPDRNGQPQVSPTGAVGAFQIEPGTAKQYGADPAKLSDPAYNKQVAGTILTDLSHRYNGDMQAMAVAYNAGPGTADRWIRDGRNMADLPNETQKYLAHLSNIAPSMGDLTQGHRDAIYDPLTSSGVPSEEPNLAAGWAALKGLPADIQKVIDDNSKPPEPTMGQEMEKNKLEEPEQQDKVISIALGFAGAGPGKIAGDVLRAYMGPARAVAYDFSRAGKSAATDVVTEAQGLIKQKTAIAAAALEQYRSLINSKLVAYKQWIDLPNKGNQPVPEIQHLINYVEGIPGVQIGGEMKDLADAMRGIYQDTRTSIENTIPNMKSFVDDYYRHMWTDPVKATQAFAGRTGSSASLKLRTIPTLAEGILTHGLVPRILDPIENTLAYVHSMQSYLANHTVREIGASIGQVKYSTSGPPVGTNWIKLKGASSNTFQGQAYAPPGWARVYNSWVGRGVYDWSNPMWGKIYDKLLVASNTMTALKLGLSGYHAWNIAQETITSGLSKALGNFEHGELGRGLAELGLTATVAPKIVKNLYRGRELRLAYLETAGAHPDDVALMKLAARSGVRVTKPAVYQGAGIPNYVKAFQAGSLKFQMKEQLAKLAGAPGETKLATGLLAPGRATEFFANQIGSTFSTIMSPLFDMAIPALKNAAWADEMEMFIRNNPNATMSELLAHGRPLSNHMDDVFGEMQQDNLYWARGFKQAMNLLTVSVGWEYGTLRAFGTGASDILNVDGLTPRSRWLISFPVMNASIANTYQYLRTGTTGFTDWQTMAGAPLTGGTNPDGSPERAWNPGPQKEPLQVASEWMQAPQVPPPFRAAIAVKNYAESKLGPAPQTLVGLATSKNYANMDLRGAYPTGALPGYWSSYVKFMEDQLTSIQLENAAEKGTKITLPERVMGIRAANKMMTNPEDFKRTMDWVDQNNLRQAQHFAGTQNAKLLAPDPTIPLVPLHQRKLR
jgi:hypothetical protein